jgi:hypothetical protein
MIYSLPLSLSHISSLQSTLWSDVPHSIEETKVCFREIEAHVQIQKTQVCLAPEETLQALACAPHRKLSKGCCGHKSFALIFYLNLLHAFSV